MNTIRQGSNYFVYPLDLRVIMACKHIHNVHDMHDKIIIATAKLLQSPVITKDMQIKTSKEVDTTW